MSIGLVERPYVKQVATVANGLFSWISVVCILFLLAQASLWCIESAPHENLYTDLNINTYPGQLITISPGVGIVTISKKAVYSSWLTDSHGTVVYVYPNVRVEGSSSVMFNKTVLIPENLAPGQYVLRARLRYPFNPFKAGIVDLNLATIDLSPNYPN